MKLLSWAGGPSPGCIAADRRWDRSFLLGSGHVTVYSQGFGRETSDCGAELNAATSVIIAQPSPCKLLPVNTVSELELCASQLHQTHWFENAIGKS